MSQDHNHLNHATWECKYHVVFTPKYRKKALFGQIRRHLGSVFHELARRKECRIEEGHLMPDHVHILISIPPKYSVAEVIGYLKGRSSIWIAQNIERKLRNFLGHKFWARGYFVSTVGRDACHPSIYPHLPERREPGISDQAAAEESQPLLEQRAQRSQPLTQRFFDRRQHLAPH